LVSCVLKVFYAGNISGFGAHTGVHVNK